MTREEILSLSGIALSEAVAQHVMGWKRVVSEITDRLGSVWEDAAGKYHIVLHRALRPNGLSLLGVIAKPWEPHKDIRAAWNVVEKMKEQGSSCMICRWIGSSVSFYPARMPDDAKNNLVGCPDEIGVPTNICQAALLSSLTPP